MNKSAFVTHTFEPVYDEKSKILILGTMPSPKSRELGFYYGHPRNRFWKVITDIFEEPLPLSIEEKKDFCIRRHIAVWDVLASCQIEGADDGSIKDPVVNDMNFIFSKAKIRAVFTTGTKATALYKKYCIDYPEIPAFLLPSTSPANCRTSYEALKRAFSVILDYV